MGTLKKHSRPVKQRDRSLQRLSLFGRFNARIERSSFRCVWGSQKFRDAACLAAIVGTFIKRRFSLADSVSKRENQGVSSLAASTGNVISTSRRQISAFVAINVPYQPPIGRNNSVINLVTFREPPSRNGPNREHGASRFTGSLRWEHCISTLSNNQSIPAAVGDYVCS